MNNIQGNILGISGNYLHGWCYNTENLHERLTLEVIHNSYVIGIIKADAFSDELQQQAIGDAHYGFVFSLPSYVLEKSGKINIKVTNTDIYLTPCIDLMNNMQLNLAEKVQSKVYSTGGLRVKGWAWSAHHPEKKLTISVYINNKKVTEFIADEFMPEFSSEVKSNGFDITLPNSLADGNKYEAHFIDENDKPLHGSPIIIAEYFNGLNKLLSDSRQNDEAFDLLSNIVKHYQNYVPRSINLNNYPEWYNHFGKLPKIKKVKESVFFIIYYDKGISVEQTKRLKDSIKKQHYKSYRLVSNYHDLKHIYQQKIKQQKVYTIIVEYNEYLADNSLNYINHSLIKGRYPSLIYTDHDEDTYNTSRSKPAFKTAWNYEYFLSFNYIGGLYIVNTELLLATNQLPKNIVHIIYQVVGLCLKNNKTIKHINKICYHKSYSQLTNTSSTTANQLRSMGLKSLLQLIEPESILKISKKHPRTYHITRPLIEQPLVSLIIPTRDYADLLEKCLNSILEKTNYRHFEILVIDNQSVEDKTFRVFSKFQRKGVRIISYDKPFNYSAINNMAVEQAKGDVIGLINNDVEVITEGWLEEMLGLLMRPNIGAVGAKLLWPNEMVQHGGVVLGVSGLAGHYGNHLHDTDTGYMYRNQVTQELSAVTAACLLIKKVDYLAVNGLNEFDFPVAFNDVDLCLKLREKGLKNIWTPHAKLWHFESASRGKEDNPIKAARAYRETQNLKKKWGDILLKDPYKPSSLDTELNGLILLNQ